MSSRSDLRALARLHGIQLGFTDAFGRRRRTSRDTLTALLSALGSPVSRARDASELLRQRLADAWRRPLEPVNVAWSPGGGSVTLRLPASTGKVTMWLRTEGGDERSWAVDTSVLRPAERTDLDGRGYVRLEVPVEAMEPGYHRVGVDLQGRSWESLLVSAPRRAHRSAARTWGVFLPLHALSTSTSWGAGDLSGLRSLLEWTGDLGGDFVATLPLLAAFLDDPFEPSPYAPVSRLFWNELYCDVAAAPQLAGCAAAQQVMASDRFRAQLQRLRGGDLVEYRGAMELKRGVLEPLAAHAFEPPADTLHEFLRAQPHADDYARFRACTERHRSGWSSWPDGVGRNGLTPDDYDESAWRYHVYAQWLAHRQFEELRASTDATLYFDLPLGVHADGYDVWRMREVFLEGASGGAPPDPVFTRGQDWGFAPLHPDGVREDEYRYPIACFRHLLRHAKVLRIDHVMGLHRLYCIPRGAAASDGAYVRYRADELYAILCLESHRAGAVLVGEDLGTVPPPVRGAMRRHGLLRTYVVQYELAGANASLAPPPAASLACVNTHDMYPFAGFWSGADIRERHADGLLDDSQAVDEQEARTKVSSRMCDVLTAQGWLAPQPHGQDPDARQVHAACLRFLGASAAEVVVANLEDLWQETEPHNVPGTGPGERPNWRRKARHGLEKMQTMRMTTDMLRELDRLRSKEVS